MAAVALDITNAIIGFSSIATGVGFGVAEGKKIDELNAKAAQLKKDAEAVGDFYDRTYYLVTENLKRVKNAVDALPTDFLEKVDGILNTATESSDGQKALSTLGKVLGYLKSGRLTVSSIINVVRAIKAHRAASGKPEPTIANDPSNPYNDVPVDAEPSPASQNETLGTTKLTNRLLFGLDVANVVFGLGGLAVTIGLGVWTLEKLNDAIDAVDKKKEEVAKFQTSMTAVLDELVTDAGLPPKSYDQLQEIAKTWRTISEHCEGYSKEFLFAVQYHFLGKSIDEVKRKVEEISNPGNPFPNSAYPLSKTLADGIRDLFDQGKSDDEIVVYYTDAAPEYGRFVLDEYFIATLRQHR